MSKGKILAVAFIWLAIVAMLAVSYKLIWAPRKQEVTLAGTSSSSHYRYQIDFAVDSFAGYAILRSPKFEEELASRKIRLRLQDDQADYAERLRKLQRGDLQMGVFTVDALLVGAASTSKLLPSIVAVIDETRGADAILAYRSTFPSIDALNAADVRFVLTRHSPSETLARVVMSRFQLDALSNDPWLPVADAASVVERYRQAKPADRVVYVAWEPFVSQLRENPEMQVLADSSSFRGCIVDVIVANRDFLLKNEEAVREVLGCYFRAAYHYRDKMPQLLVEDAKSLGTPLKLEQAERMVQGIWWKNTLENFAHFGIDTSGQLQLLEDIILNLADVLQTTGVTVKDPTDGHPERLYFDQPLRELRDSNFHPGLSQEEVRDDRVVFRALPESAWEQLTTMGTLSIPDVVFARGTATLTDASQRSLDRLSEELETLPNTYLLVTGNAAARGDPEANRALAEARAVAVRDYLVQAGVAPNRMRAVGGEPKSGSTVSLLLGRPPY